MTSKFLPGLAAIVLTLTCMGAQASTADSATLMRLSGVNQLALSGGAIVEYVQGRPLMQPPITRSAFEASARGDDEAALYYTEDGLLTVGLGSLAAFVLAIAGLQMRAAAKREAREVPCEAWREELFVRLAADLANLDSLVHGYSGR